MASGPSTASADSMPTPSWNTESQESARCSAGPSRSHDHAITAVSVWCRTGAERSRLRSRAEAAAPPEPGNRALEPLAELLERHGPDAGGSQLDGERKTVEPRHH